MHPSWVLSRNPRRLSVAEEAFERLDADVSLAVAKLGESGCGKRDFG
jgi:hypothetical protein